MLWIRFGGGSLLALVGVLWILQGVDVVGGSGMSGHGQYAALDVMAALAGVWLMWGAIRACTRSQKS